MPGAGEGALAESLVHHVEGPVEPLVVLPARRVLLLRSSQRIHHALGANI